jgi:putative aldouronate transport system substrate-binding protein
VSEWYDYLKTVKQGDPNGNGKADELPLIGQGYAGLLQTQRMFGIEPNQLFYQENGRLVTSIDQPEYREWLLTMARWYKEGLIDPDVLSTNRQMLDNKVLTHLAGSFWSGAGTGQLGLYMKQKQNAGDTAFSLNPVPMPTTARGERLAWIKIVPDLAAGITTTNKYPAESVRFFDYFFTDQGHRLSQLGPEGKAYNTVNGEIAFTDLVTKNPDGLSFDSALIKHGLAPMDFVGYQLSGYWKFNISFTPQAASSDKIWADYTHDKLVTGLRFTAAEASKVAAITNDLKALVEETVSKIILGQSAISRYDEMVAQARRAGIEELKAIYVAAYERSKKR